MPQGEPETHSFIIKFWLEEEADDGRRLWRGHITHVSDGERRPVRRLEDVSTFIDSYLGEAGTRRGLLSRIGQWVRRPRRIDG